MKIFTEDAGFAYDIYGLVQAFYPYMPLDIIQDDNESYEEEILSVKFGKDRISFLIDGVLCGETDVSGTDRHETKNRLKRLLYEVLSERTNVTLPWGTLTGIRPTKIPLKMLTEGRSSEEISSYMKEKYLCSDEKIRLATDIAKRELSVLGEMGDAYALYIGIPFCPSICLYCSFSSYPIGVYRRKVDAYLEALEKEIAYVGKKFMGRRLSMMYIGGGTPTSLSAEQLKGLMDVLHRHLDLSGLREFTVEAGRPDSITKEKLKVLADAGVGRISINPQTMQEKTLETIGRFHSVEQVVASYHMAREFDFLINMDLIIGLPGETAGDVADTLSQIRRLAADNLTVHSLAIKRSSRLNEHLTQYGDALLINSAELMDRVTQEAKQMGMSPYYLYRQKQISGNLENIGFAPPGKECLYNIVMMEELSDVVALGAGSVSKRIARLDEKDGAYDLTKKIQRAENVKDVDLYIQKIQEMQDRKDRLFFAEK